MPLSDLQIVLDQRPLGIVFDIDGTLSPIAPTPDEAQLFPGVVSLLEELHKKAHIAILTGRAIDNGAKMVNMDGLTYIGSHGLEWSEGLPWLHPVRVVPGATEYIESVKKLLDLAHQQLAQQPGITVEYKGIGGTIHYRLAPDPEQARQMILSLLEKPAQQANLYLNEGKRAVEVRVPLKINKGQALRQFSQQWNLQGIVFAGDDRTDLDAILEIDPLREEGKAALGVVVEHLDTLPELLQYADIVVQEVEGMVKLLHEIVRYL